MIREIIIGSKKYLKVTHWSAGVISILCLTCLLGELHTQMQAYFLVFGLSVGVVTAFHFANWEKSFAKWIGWLLFSLYLVLIAILIIRLLQVNI